MTLSRHSLPSIALALTVFVITSCDTTRNIYKSSSSKNDYIIINAVTLTHCGCTEIYAESFKNSKREFQIFYNDNLARKTMFTYSLNSKKPTTTSLLATPDDNFTTPFDDLDSKIFSIIDSALASKQGSSYRVRRIFYKGYITDTLIQRSLTY